jgi:hypothetical protein
MTVRRFKNDSTKPYSLSKVYLQSAQHSPLSAKKSNHNLRQITSGGRLLHVADGSVTSFRAHVRHFRYDLNFGQTAASH